MKKKIIISIAICLVLVIGIIGYILFNNRVTSTITLDINPSIEINLTRNNKVKNVVALNDDANKIIDNSFKGQSLDDALDLLVENIIKNDYLNEERVVDIILYSKGDISSKELKGKLNKIFEDKNIPSNIIIVENVTKEDEELAKKYNISPAKVSYINSITKDNNDIDIEQFTDKSVKELELTKETGNYCDEGYDLMDGNHCFKEINRVPAKNGEVCPRGTYDYKGKCYDEVPIEETNKLICNKEFNLVNNKCVKTISMNAEPSKYYCTSGKESTRYEAGLTGKNDGDANDIVCVDTSKAKHPISPCETHDGTEYTKVGGKCYWHRASILPEGCPGKIKVGGFCWDDATNILICEGDRDGKRYSSRSEYCEKSIKYNNPVVTEYKCEDDFTLDGKKCIKEEIEDAFYERVCPSGYSLVDNGRCINKNKEIPKENGLVCNGDETTKLIGKECITYEIIDAKKY